VAVRAELRRQDLHEADALSDDVIADLMAALASAFSWQRWRQHSHGSAGVSILMAALESAFSWQRWRQHSHGSAGVSILMAALTSPSISWQRWRQHLTWTR
jgi:hypothetical protein